MQGWVKWLLYLVLFGFTVYYLLNIYEFINKTKLELLFSGKATEFILLTIVYAVIFSIIVGILRTGADVAAYNRKQNIRRPPLRR